MEYLAKEFVEIGKANAGLTFDLTRKESQIREMERHIHNLEYMIGVLREELEHERHK